MGLGASYPADALTWKPKVSVSSRHFLGQPGLTATLGAVCWSLVTSLLFQVSDEKRFLSGPLGSTLPDYVVSRALMVSSDFLFDDVKHSEHQGGRRFHSVCVCDKDITFGGPDSGALGKLFPHM